MSDQKQQPPKPFGGFAAFSANPLPGSADPTYSMKPNLPSLFSTEPKKQGMTLDGSTASAPPPPFASLSGFGLSKDTAKDGNKDNKVTTGTTEKTNTSDGKAEAKANAPVFPAFGLGGTSLAAKDGLTASTPTPPFASLSGFGLPKDTAKDGNKDNKLTTGTAEKTNTLDGKAEAKPNVPVFPAFGLSGTPSANKLGSTADTAATGPAVTTTNNTGVPPKVCIVAPSTLRGKSVEDIVIRWSTELETHTREFSKFASEVAVWDRTLIENGNYIAALYATVISAESTQASLDQTLDHVEQQQGQLTATLDQYEKTAHEVLHGSGGIMTSTEGLGLADSERDKSYALAANLYTQLDDLSRSLTQMVENVNNLNLSPGFSAEPTGQEDAVQEDPISTISGILNAHLSSLQWIDNSLKDMGVKVKDAERKINDASARRISHGESTGRGRAFGLRGSLRG